MSAHEHRAHRFSSPLARDLFAIVADAGLSMAEEARRERREKAEKANRAAAEADEYFTEGRHHRRPDRINPHD